MKNISDLPNLDRQKKRWKKILDDIYSHRVVLTVWERNFLKSIKLIVDNGGCISMQQSITLNKIYDKACMKGEIW